MEGGSSWLWFVLRKVRLFDLPIGSDEIYRSESFPGLWLDPAALLRGDTRHLRAVVDLAAPRRTRRVRGALAAARESP